MKISMLASAMLMLLSLTNAIAQDGEFHLEKDFKIAPSGTLDINTSDAKVFITGTTRSNAHLKIDRRVSAKGWRFGEEEFRVDVDEEEGNLIIRERQRGSNIGVIGVFNEDYRIDIDLPSGVSLKVRGDDGDYYIKSINGSIVLNLDDADAELSGCKGQNFEFRLDDGEIHMDEGRGSLDLIADDADIEIHHAHFSKIQADVDDGDLIIETSLADKGEYFIESQDGTIVLDITGGGGQFNIRHDDGNVTTEGDFKMVQRGENETKVSLGNGSAKISVRADDARVRLRAN